MFRCLTKLNTNTQRASLADALFMSDFADELNSYFRGTGKAPAIDSLVKEINTDILPKYLASSGKYGIEDVIETLNDPDNALAIDLAFKALLSETRQINLKATLPKEPYAQNRNFNIVDELVKDLGGKVEGINASSKEQTEANRKGNKPRSMEIIPPALKFYLETHCDPEPEHLQFINRETHLKVLKPNMLSGHYQGRVLSMLSKMMQPKLIVEIGTFTGYATLCLAEGLAEDGIIHTIEVNREMEEMLNSHFKLTNVGKKIKLHFGPAKDFLVTFLEKSVDLVFIDADKKNNFLYFEMIFEKVRPGGLIIIDNVLWKGKVYGAENDADTQSFRKLNDRITGDERVEKLILPVRDGLLVIRKK